MLPKFTLGLNTAAAPGAVFVHHNRSPLCVAKLIVFPNHAAAMQWANDRADNYPRPSEDEFQK